MNSPESEPHDKTVTELIAAVQQLVSEVHPVKARTLRLDLDSRLDTDLGLDSLGRGELISRLEKKFNIVLPEHVFAESESLRDLLRAITIAQDRLEVHAPRKVTQIEIEKVEQLPVNATTLVEVLEWHVKQHPRRLHIRVLANEGEEDTLTYEELWQGARSLGDRLCQHPH